MAQPLRPDADGADRTSRARGLLIRVVGHSGARPVVRIAGRRDAGAAPILAHALAAATPAPRRGPPRLAIDLSGVTYIDGAGLQVLLDLQDRLAGLSGELELLAPTPAVVGLLHEAHIHGTAGLPGTDCPGSVPASDGSPFGGRPGLPGPRPGT